MRTFPSLSCLAFLGALLLAGPAAATYVVVDTGQEVCSDTDGNVIGCPAPGEALYGQDAQFDGVPFGFVDNGDGTVTDLNTGLQWQKTPSTLVFGWQAAMDYCASLELAGHDDWRAPSLKELFSISDFSQGWPYLDTGYFDLAGAFQPKDEQFWSSDFYLVGTTHGGQASAFGVNSATGHIKAYPAEAPGPMGNYVRAVRGDAHGENDFLDNGDGTVTDRATGLMWMQGDGGGAVDWGQALLLADTLSLAGHDDWRLPDVKELQSIVDYSGVFPAIDPVFSCTGIVNEAGEDDYGYYWTGTSAYFGPDSPEYYYAWYVAFGRAVDDAGNDMHGAGAVRFDTKVEGGPLGEGGERIYNFVRCVRDNSVTTGIGSEPGDGAADQEEIPQAVTLHPVHPNPFNPSATIRFALPEPGQVRLQVFDLRGRPVRTIVDGPRAAGMHELVWQGTDDAGRTLASGTYLLRLETTGGLVTQRVTLLK